MHRSPSRCLDASTALGDFSTRSVLYGHFSLTGPYQQAHQEPTAYLDIFVWHFVDIHVAVPFVIAPTPTFGVRISAS